MVLHLQHERRFLTECRKTKSKPIAYQLEYSANHKPQWIQNESNYLSETLLKQGELKKLTDRQKPDIGNQNTTFILQNRECEYECEYFIYPRIVE